MPYAVAQLAPCELSKSTPAAAQSWAERISLLYERARVLHRRGLEKLESEMLSFSRDWSRDVDGSPNRLDAANWALSRLAKIQTTIPIA
jgi:phage terminase large subunit-like protein